MVRHPLDPLIIYNITETIFVNIGWMLREVGKRCNDKILTDFLDQHSHEMPRTMLRYAIERLPEIERKRYLSK